MVSALRSVASGKRRLVVCVVTARGIVRWELRNAANSIVEWKTYSHVDAANWVMQLEDTSFVDAAARIDETVKWANRVISDQDIVLHDAPGSSCTSGACGQ